MPDDADMANDHIEKELVQRIAAARRTQPIGQPTSCMNCGEPIQLGRYCDTSCRDDYDVRSRNLKRAGLV